MTTDIDLQALAERAARLEGWDYNTELRLWRSPKMKAWHRMSCPTLRERSWDRLLWLVYYADAVLEGRDYTGPRGREWRIRGYQFNLPAAPTFKFIHPDPDYAVSLAFCAVVEAAAAVHDVDCDLDEDCLCAQGRQP